MAHVGPTAAQSWSDVLAPDLRFKLEMPAPVERRQAAEREASFDGVRTVYQSALAGQNFDFDYVDYKQDIVSKRDSKAMVREIGRGAVEKAFPTARFTYLRDEAVTLSGWDGYALDIEGAAGEGVVMRTYLVKTRLYRLLVTYSADNASKEAARRFVESFKVAESR
ncbi:MAG TPA: hypothetical protein VJ890_28830 [Vineibacter sp.]|nr:hypothetical protein [Vineibacter sp.]